jgi:hypothetical protein
MEEQREKTMLLGADKTSGKEHGLGLMHPWVDYAVHIPFRVPRIPHSEGATFWDNWLHHTDSTPPVSDPEASKSSPAEPAPTPPLAVRLGALLLLFLLVFGPTLSYSSVGALYTQLKTDMGYRTTRAPLGNVELIDEFLCGTHDTQRGLQVHRWAARVSVLGLRSPQHRGRLLCRGMRTKPLCVSCRVVSCRVVSCRVVSCRVVSCRVVCRVSCVVCRVVSCRVSCRVVSCRV